MVMVSGVAAKENRKSLDGRWDKYDEKDAANVADLIAQGKFLFYEYVEQGIARVTGFIGVEEAVEAQEHGYRMRIRNHLVAKYFPELDRYYDQSETCDLAIVRWCLDPQVLSAMEFEKFAKLVCGKKGNGPQDCLMMGGPFLGAHRIKVTMRYEVRRR